MLYKSNEKPYYAIVEGHWSQQCCLLQGNPNMIMALAGNKADLAEARAVTKEEAQSYADENSLVFWETSAKANLNVLEVFQSIAEKLPKAASASAQQPQSNIQLHAQLERPKRAGCCG